MRLTGQFGVVVGLYAAFFAFLFSSICAQAQVNLRSSASEQVRRFDIPGKDLNEALIDFAIQSGTNVIAESQQLSGMRSSPVVGLYTLEHALYLLLGDSPFDFTLNSQTNTISLQYVERAPLPQVVEQAGSTILEEPVMTEELVVKGIRASLLRAMDLKYASTSILEAITEEDMGKFPDSNLSESLQRVSGVTISYDNNEGNKVRVRGLDSGFSLVTLNGRQMPTADVKAGKAAGTRSFNFADLSSDNIAAVEIYKTVEASRPSGGIGSVINILTARPLDVEESRGVVNVKFVADNSNVNGDDITPEVSGLYSFISESEQLGFLLSASYQARDSRAELADMFWLKNLGLTDEFDHPYNVPDEFKDENFYIWYPDYYELNVTDYQRERINAHAAAQYSPLPQLRFTVDYTFADLDVKSNSSFMLTEFPTRVDVDSLQFGEAGTVLAATSFFRGYSFGQERGQSSNNNSSLGFNVNYQLHDWELTFDAHSSTAQLKPDGRDNRFSLKYDALNAYQTNYSVFDSSIPFLNVNFYDELVADTVVGVRSQLYPEDFVRHLKGESLRHTADASIDQVQLDASWFNEEGFVAAFNVGVSLTEQRTESKLTQVLFNDPTYGTTQWFDTDDYDLALYYEENFAGLLSEVDGGVGGSVPVYSFDLDRVIADVTRRLANNDNGIMRYHPQSTFSWSVFMGEQFETDKEIVLSETTQSAYAELLLNNDTIVDFEWLLGVRYESTEVNSESNIRIPFGIEWSNPETLVVRYTADKTAFYDSHSYDYLLPSSTLKINITDDISLRIANSQSISRSEMYLVQQDFDVYPFLNDVTNQLTTGDITLKPYESSNSDVFLDWYYSDTSYLSVGIFTKLIDNYPIKAREERQFNNITTPLVGPRMDAARQWLIDNGQEINDVNLFAYFEANYEPTSRGGFLGSADDAQYLFLTESYENSESVNLEGWEFTLQHIFGESGLGVVFNYTHVESDFNFNVNFEYPEAAYPYGGDFFNLISFYENETIQVRLAYHWNDEFIELQNASIYLTPIYTAPYGQLDALLSYNIRENIALVVEGINLTNETQRTYSVVSSRTVSAGQFGSRYSLGLRVSF